MYRPYYCRLSAPGAKDVTIYGDGRLDALGLMGDGIVGWDSMPAVKVDVTARGQGDGGHDIAEDGIMYASRTVTIHWQANAADRDGVHTLTDMLRRFAHRLVRLQVCDAEQYTYCDGGYLTLEQSSVYRHAITEASTITIVFERPERLAVAPRIYQLLPLSDNGQGLYYSNRLTTWWEGEPNNSVSVLQDAPGPDGLAYPVSYGRTVGDGRNRAVLDNKGTSRAYPVIEVSGSFPHGVDLQYDTGARITYSQPLEWGGPLLLDTRSRTASIDGADVSRYLTGRGFETVPAASSRSLVLNSKGDGLVTVTVHDTWI